MITFNKKGKFEYQIMCGTKKPLYISLLPNNTISNKFDSVISSIQAMSEIMGQVFDDHIFNFVNDYQKFDIEDQKYAFLKKSVYKTLQISTVFVNANNINYAGFADESQRTNDSIFFDKKDILKFVKLSQALKIYSIVQNTQIGIRNEKYQEIYHQFLTLLKADHLPFKLLKFIEMLSINAKKNKIRDYSEKKVDDEDNISILIFETLNFILYQGLIIHEYKRNPILFFVGILKTNIEYGGKYRPDKAIKFIDDLAKKNKGNISKRESDLKEEANKDILNRLHRISLFYLVSVYEGLLKIETGNMKYPKFLKGIKYTSPFWDLILAPLLSKVTGISYERLKIISPQQAAAISFYSGIKLESIFKNRYQNLFELAYLFPTKPPDFRYYRLRNISKFINATLLYPINDLARRGDSRISFARLIEDFIGKISSTPFRRIISGDLIGDIQTDKIEIETIDYFVRYHKTGFKQESRKFATAFATDFKYIADRKPIRRKKGTLKNAVNGKKYSPSKKSNLKSINNEGETDKSEESKTDKETYYKNTNADSTPTLESKPVSSKKNRRTKESTKRVKSKISKTQNEEAYQNCKDAAGNLVHYLENSPTGIDQYFPKFQQNYDLMSDSYKKKILDFANRRLLKKNRIIVKSDGGSLVIGKIAGHKISTNGKRVINKPLDQFD